MQRMTILFLLLAVGMVSAGCENAQRSMVFFTGTTLGVEIAFEPQSTTPAKFIVGYKRAEGLMDPVMEDCCCSTDGNTCCSTNGKCFTIKKDPHSVLAKIAGEVDSGGGNSVNGAQWFASGRAAELLAANPLTAATLVNNVTSSATIARAASNSESLQRILTITPEKEALQARFDELLALDLEPNFTEDGRTFTDTDQYAEYAAGEISGDPNKGWVLIRMEGGDELARLVEKLETAVQDD